MNSPRLRTGAAGIIVCAALILLGEGNAPAQTPPPIAPPSTPAVAKEKSKEKEEDRIQISVNETAWAANGDLILAVRIQAPGTRDLALGGPSKRPGPLAPANGSSPPMEPFTLGDSYMVDTYTNKKLLPNSTIPRRPYFGPMQIISQLKKSGWIQLGVGYPKPPTPPPGKDGRPQDYKLLLHVAFPGNQTAEPLLITIPWRP